MKQIPFNRPYMTGRELDYVLEAKQRNMLAGDGWFTKQCHQWLESNVGTKKALLTHSCTSALEMAALLLDIQPGDEVIMPSYTFVSTANAFVLRGGVPVFRRSIVMPRLRKQSVKPTAASSPFLPA